MDCANLSELTRAEWSHSLLRQLNGSRYPLGGTFELTERCNLACVHCFINQPVGCKAASAREMSLTQIRGLFDQLASVGCLWLLLTGGEVLLRPDFLEIYEYAKRRGLLLTLFTNGTLLTPRIADFLAEFPPVRLEITLYGLTPQTYERVTGVPGSHARCLRGIELALDRGLPLGLKAVVLRANQHELEGMQRFADGLGTDFRYDGMLWPRLDGGGKANPCQIPAAEVAALDMDGAQRHAAWQEYWDRSGGVPARVDYLYHCGSGQHGFHIDASGRLSMCMMARHPAYDLLHGSFEEGWQRHLGALRAVKRSRHVACQDCRFLALCGQCPGWAQQVHGDDETPVDFVCQVGHQRAARLGLLDQQSQGRYVRGKEEAL